ncbi:MAG: hypothetical protein WAK17_26640 [Candidatus Nitrosopolaris sp.]
MLHFSISDIVDIIIRIIIVDSGSINQTKEIALAYDKADYHVRPDLNLGQATQFGLLFVYTASCAFRTFG